MNEERIPFRVEPIQKKKYVHLSITSRRCVTIFELSAMIQIDIQNFLIYLHAQLENTIKPTLN